MPRWITRLRCASVIGAHLDRVEVLGRGHCPAHVAVRAGDRVEFVLVRLPADPADPVVDVPRRRRVVDGADRVANLAPIAGSSALTNDRQFRADGRGGGPVRRSADLRTRSRTVGRGASIVEGPGVVVQCQSITGAIMLIGPAGANTEVTSTSCPVASACCTCAAVVNGWVARSMLPGVASTSRTSVQAPE